MVIYSGIQKNARDARRRADIDSIGNALEANYGKDVPGKYKSLIGSMFSSGTIPVDPVNTLASTTDSKCPTVCKYCVVQASNSVPAAAACVSTGATVGQGWPITNFPYWIICANLENGGYICRSNQQ